MPATHVAGTVPYLLWFPPSSAAADGITLDSRPQMEKEAKTQSREPVGAPTHIIERPRLIKLMEDSGARVIVLHAPAGYGKTTLARQWCATAGRTAIWLRCTTATSDIAVLAGSLADALSREVPGAGGDLVKRSRSTSDPSTVIETFQDTLMARLDEWPPEPGSSLTTTTTRQRQSGPTRSSRGSCQTRPSNSSSLLASVRVGHRLGVSYTGRS